MPAAKAKVAPADAFCVLIGRPGVDPLTLVGPFASADEAGEYATTHRASNPQAPVFASALLNPANCP